MSDAYYYLKATFPNSDIEEKITEFFKEMYAISLYWHGNRDREDMDEVFKEIPIKFPVIARYINSLNLTQPYNGNTLSGKLLWSYEENLDEDLTIEGNEIKWAAEQSTFLDLDDLVKFFVTEFGALNAQWTTNEQTDYWDLMDAEDSHEIVKAILCMDKTSLPTFMNIHPLLDNKISNILSKD